MPRYAGGIGVLAMVAWLGCGGSSALPAPPAGDDGGPIVTDGSVSLPAMLPPDTVPAQPAACDAGCGGACGTPFVSNQTEPYPVIADTTNLYWANYDGMFSASLWTVPLSGGPPTKLAAGAFNVSAMAVDATSLYLAAYVASDEGAIMKVSKTGGDSGPLPASPSTRQRSSGAPRVIAARGRWAR